jgi:hypothetical protein
VPGLTPGCRHAQGRSCGRNRSEDPWAPTYYPSSERSERGRLRRENQLARWWNALSLSLRFGLRSIRSPCQPASPPAASPPTPVCIAAPRP